MLLPRLQPPLRAAISSIARSSTSTTPTTSLSEAFAALSFCSRGQGLRVSGVRYASHKAQGAVNKAKDGPGKRLGAKKSGEQYVIPGNIIFRQRGTHWFPGDNCGMGRDHTIFAKEHGYVKYYKDPEKHPKRQYIGVVFERDMVLPQPKNSMRRRRLGMTTSMIAGIHTSATNSAMAAVPSGEIFIGDEAQRVVVSKSTVPAMVMVGKERKGEEGRRLTLRPGYMYRESNWEIGRAAERAKIKIREYKPRDRWMAWKKMEVRKTKSAEKRGLKGRAKSK